jgi:hypothetical protein
MVRCLPCIFIIFLIYITEFIINKYVAGHLKCLNLSEENKASELYLDQDSGEKLVHEVPAVRNVIFFLGLFKR